MGRYAMVVTASGLIDNVIVYDGVSPFTPPTGIELVEDILRRELKEGEPFWD